MLSPPSDYLFEIQQRLYILARKKTVKGTTVRPNCPHQRVTNKYLSQYMQPEENEVLLVNGRRVALWLKHEDCHPGPIKMSSKQRNGDVDAIFHSPYWPGLAWSQ
jgi:hypothetical protein